MRNLGGKGSGRKRRYDDQFHRVMRQRQRRYYAKNRGVINYAMRHKISLDEARKRLKKEQKK